jgi:hypothetical protein
VTTGTQDEESRTAERSRPAPAGAHALLVDPALTGFEYGMQRDFEAEIARVTGAEPVSAPRPPHPRLFRRLACPGSRWSWVLPWLPKARFRVEADVLWVVLMGPECYPLWLHRGLERHAGKKVLYLYDTFESQAGIIRDLLRRARWDLCVTSFPAAVPFLERETGREWLAVLQGVLPERFFPLPEGGEPAVAFSAYGRRVPSVHAAVREFTRERGLHYDYTVAAGLQPGLDPRENYQQYAWHLRQSWFTFSWPVELTNPGRARGFSPVTCRWFEAAASGTVVLGHAPKDPAFEEAFGPGLVVPFDPGAPPERMRARLADLWASRRELRAQALERHRGRAAGWTWEDRVRQLLAALARS